MKDKSNIAKALKKLIAKGHIEKISEHDSPTQKGAIYRVGLAKKYLTKGPKLNQPVVEKRERVKATKTSGRSNHKPVVDLTTKKENINKTIKKTLSGELENFFKGLPKKKRELEFEAYQELSENFSDDEILLCVQFVETHGELSKGNKVHSPFRYLQMAMADVLAKVNLKGKNIRVLAEKAAQAKANEIAEEKKNRDEAVEAEKAFKKAFPGDNEQKSTQENILESIPFRVPDHLARGVAISVWYKNNQQTQESMKEAL